MPALQLLFVIGEEIVLGNLEYLYRAQKVAAISNLTYHVS